MIFITVMYKDCSEDVRQFATWTEAIDFMISLNRSLSIITAILTNIE